MTLQEVHARKLLKKKMISKRVKEAIIVENVEDQKRILDEARKIFKAKETIFQAKEQKLKRGEDLHSRLIKE